MNIVEHSKIGVATDSLVVSRKLGVKHSHVMTVIRAMLDDYPDLKGGITDSPFMGEKWMEIDKVRKGQRFKIILMNRQFFSLLVVRFRTKQAREWHRNFNDAFYAMEDRLLQMEHNKKSEEWQGLRSQGKLCHREYTDAVQEFVEYATEQGSKSAKHYYSNIQKATYKALNMIQKVRPTIRDTLDGLQLSQLEAAENMAKKALRKYMAQGEPYKAIYVLVKADIENLAEAMMIEKPAGSSQ